MNVVETVYWWRGLGQSRLPRPKRKKEKRFATLAMGKESETEDPRVKVATHITVIVENIKGE